MEEIGRSIGSDPKLIDDKLATYIKEIGVYAANARTIHITEAKERAWENYLAVILVRLLSVALNRMMAR